jgi:hypothetical protein
MSIFAMLEGNTMQLKRKKTTRAKKTVPPLRLYQGGEQNDAPENPPEQQRHEPLFGNEQFWAGRNHAMRQSARIAA